MTTLHPTRTRVGAERGRRRSIAVISHPDAGRSTLNEALALHAHVISEAGAVHGKQGRSGVVSDWLEMDQKRGISITSAALQFSFQDFSAPCSSRSPAFARSTSSML